MSRRVNSHPLRQEGLHAFVNEAWCLLPVKVGSISIRFSSWFHRTADNIGFSSGFEDMGAISDAIQQRFAQADVGEDAESGHHGGLPVPLRKMTSVGAAR